MSRTLCWNQRPVKGHLGALIVYWDQGLSWDEGLVCT